MFQVVSGFPRQNGLNDLGFDFLEMDNLINFDNDQESNQFSDDINFEINSIITKDASYDEKLKCFYVSFAIYFERFNNQIKL